MITAIETIDQAKAKGSQMDLDQIENRLMACMQNEKGRWVGIYRLMNQVDAEKLWRPKYRSYTAWVNAMAEESGTHVSLWWQRLKAGRYYDRITKMETMGADSTPSNSKSRPDQGRQTQPPAVPAESVVLIEKIAGENLDMGKDLLQKAETGELTNRDLKNAYKAVRAEKEKQKAEASRERETSQTKDASGASDTSGVSAQTGSLLSAAEIATALGRSDSWLGTAVEKKNLSIKRRGFTEFAVDTGSSYHSRRIDYLVIENITTPEHSRNDIRIHAVEIKVDLHDLTGDHKMMEYVPFCDCFWIAVPADRQDMISAAEDLEIPGAGLLAVSGDQEVAVVHSAEVRTGTQRMETLATALLKIM